MIRTAFLSVALLLATLGVSPPAFADEVDDQKVVSSAPPLFDVLSGIGGKRVHATDLVPLDPYASLTDDKEQKLRQADLAVILGGGVQPEIERIANERTAPTIRVLEELAGATATDPFVWLDPNNMMVIAELVKSKLVQLDPDGKSRYVKNQARMHRMLEDIDRIHERTLAGCERRDLATTQPHFRYLATRFHLNQILVDVATLEMIPKGKVTTVFMDSLPSLDRAQEIRERSGFRSAALDSMFVRPDQARRGGASYGSLMALNLDALREALSCEKVKLSDQ